MYKEKSYQRTCIPHHFLSPISGKYCTKLQASCLGLPNPRKEKKTKNKKQKTKKKDQRMPIVLANQLIFIVFFNFEQGIDILQKT
jgi:hypothetical protein